MKVMTTNTINQNHFLNERQSLGLDSINRFCEKGVIWEEIDLNQEWQSIFGDESEQGFIVAIDDQGI